MDKLKRIIFYKDNIIVDCIETKKDIDSLKSLYPDCKLKEVDLNSDYHTNADITHFSKEGKKYSNKELIEKKLLTLKEDEKLNDTTDLIEKLTEIELIENGIKELPATQKIITLDNGEKQIVSKTFEELKAENLLPASELLAYEKQQAITRLSQIDIESIRPLRAVADNTATEYDLKKLHDLDTEASKLREVLSK